MSLSSVLPRLSVRAALQANRICGGNVSMKRFSSKSGHGVLSVDQFKQLIKKDDIRTVIMAFPDAYGRMFGKRYDAEFFAKAALDDGGHCCTYLLTTDMDMNAVPGFKLASWEKGYGDFHMVADHATIRGLSWQDRTALVLCDLHDPKTHKPVPQAPRSVLINQLRKVKDLGFGSVKAATELEFFQYKDSYEEAFNKNYQGLTPSGWYSEDYHILQGTRNESFMADIRHHLKASGIPVETSKGETGISQHEVNISYEEALAMADRHLIYKQCLKELAMKHNKSITFMAKPHPDQAGSSCHLHLSLHGPSGENLFRGQQSLTGEIRSSELFRQFLAGWMKYTPELFAFYAPTVNSYKRYRAGTWAPTASSWSYDNRTAAFRVVGQEKSLRIECRLPGADCNPYLGIAAAVASGLQGIVEKLDLPPMFNGNAYDLTDKSALLPRTLTEATQRLENSKFAREHFGDDVVDHYAHFFRTEQEEFERVVTDWERKRYFEQI